MDGLLQNCVEVDHYAYQYAFCVLICIPLSEVYLCDFVYFCGVLINEWIPIKT